MQIQLKSVQVKGMALRTLRLCARKCISLEKKVRFCYSLSCFTKYRHHPGGNTMKKFRVAVALFVLVFGLATMAHAGLDDFMRRVNEQAISDIDRFHARISAQFGIPIPKIQDVLKKVPSPADAFMVFQLGQMSNKHPDAVLHTYQANRDKGWGAIAHELGIKPGSAEFHALKEGNLHFTGEPGSGAREHGKGKGKGKGKKHKKD
jgi:hypothetical protein